MLLVITMAGCSQVSAEKEQEQLSVMEDIDTQTVFTVEEIKAGIEDSQYLDGVHHDNNVSCEKCHGTVEEGTEIKLPGKEVCLECHNERYHQLAKEFAQMEQYKGYNPHSPPHEGEKCFYCHRAHQPFEMTCSVCHPVYVSRGRYK